MPDVPPDIAVTVARIDERTQAMARDIEEMKAGHGNYVTQAEFWPIRTGFYGLCGVILLAVVVALIAMVVMRNENKAGAMGPELSPSAMADARPKSYVFDGVGP